MKDFPKHINSKEDLSNLKTDYPIETKRFLEGLIEASNDWIVVKELEDGEVGIEDNTHKVVENKTDDVVTVLLIVQGLFQFQLYLIVF